MPPHKQSSNHLLIYAGVAGAVLALLVILKRKGASEQPAPAAQEPVATTYTTTPGAVPAYGESAANAASILKNELGNFEQQLGQQLPEAITAGVKVGLAETNLATNRTGERGGARGAAALAAWERLRRQQLRSTP